MTPLSLSIVIPTHDRGPVLQRCLAALSAQQRLPADTEIIVVDDGSIEPCDVIVAEADRQSACPIRLVRQAPAGPAAARNRGVRHARGEVILFLGDDIMASPSLVAEHCRVHTQQPDPMVGVLGFVTWSSHIAVTPYMQWLEASGNQFAYGALRDGDWVDPARFLYTSNVSLKRSVFDVCGEWFDERFRHALLEDIDLGRRLAARGLRLAYTANATATHEHAVTLDSYARRIELSSEYWILLEKKTVGSRDAPSDGIATEVPRDRRRPYAAYAWFLVRLCGEVGRNWPFWRLARYFERRRVAPTVFRRAHRYWAHRGLLKLEARKARARLGSTS